MECNMKFSIKVTLPRFSSVKNTILKYSSLVALDTGARFRVCNVCGKQLAAKLSKEHAKHLKTHDKTWKSYKNKLCDNLKESIKTSAKELERKEDGDDEDDHSSSYSDDFSNLYNVVGNLGLNHKPWTYFEKKQLRQKFN